jgi:hypothetical protein
MKQIEVVMDTFKRNLAKSNGRDSFTFKNGKKRMVLFEKK